MANETTGTTSQTAGEAGSSTNDGATGGTTATQTAGQGQTERTFTQADIDRIVKDRLKDEQARAAKKAEEEDAKKRGEWETVASTERQAREAAETSLKMERAQNAVLKAAVAANIVDPDAAFVLLRDSIEFDDDGKPKDVDKLIATLAKEKTYLVKQEQQQSAGIAGNVATGRGGGGVKLDPRNPPRLTSLFNK